VLLECCINENGIQDANVSVNDLAHGPEIEFRRRINFLLAIGLMIERIVHPNQAVILMDHQPQLSTIALNFTFRIGCRHEPSDIEGATHFIEHLLFKGTSKRDVNEIAREINRQGGSFNAVTSTDYMRLETRVIPDDFEDALGLLHELVTDSVIPEKEFERERGVILEEIAEYNDSPEDKCFDEWLCALWSKQLLGRPVLGTDESINNMDRRSLIKWFRKLLHPSQCILSVAGPIEDTHRKALDNFFENWRHAEEPIPVSHKASGVPGRLIFPRNLEQVQFCLGMEAMPRNHEQRIPFQLGELILGGGMGSRLFTEIRERRGLAYTIASSYYGMKEEGYFLVYGSTISESIEDVLELCRYEIQKFIHDGPTDEELRIAKEQFRRIILLCKDSPSTFASRNADRELYGDQHVEEEELLQKFSEVTAEQVRSSCAQVMDQELTECLVGVAPPHLNQAQAG